MNFKKQFHEWYQEIREIYFPNWDVDHDWTLELLTYPDRPPNAATAYCEIEKKQILINYDQCSEMTAEGAYAFIIHEICHDTSSERHDDAWVDEMNRCKEIAYSRGDDKVAKQLAAQVFADTGKGDFEEFRNY